MEHDTRLVLGLLLNLILPGAGSLLLKHRKAGLWQLSIAVVSIPLMFLVIGFVTFFLAWAWGVVTAVRTIAPHPSASPQE